MSQTTRIFLTGFMGTGKSTLGPRLARRLGYRFLDLDAEIARRAGRSIPDIFREQGEAAFRALEAEEVSRIVNLEEVVVALGGGAVADLVLRRQLKAAGFLLCLQVSTPRLTARLARSATRRPLLRGRDGEQLYGDALRERVEQLLEERASAYADAHVTVNVEAPSIGQAVGLLADAVATWREHLA